MNLRRRRVRLQQWTTIFIGVIVLTGVLLWLSFRRTNLNDSLLRGIEQGNLAQIRSSVQQGANVNVVVHDAATLDFRRVIARFWPGGRSVDESDAKPTTPLMEAIRQDRAPVGELLLDIGAYPDQRNADQETAVMLIWNSAHWKRLYASLVRHGADLNACNKDGSNSLDYAVSSLNWDAVLTLLETSPRASSSALWKRRYGEVMIIATGNGESDVVSRLLELGADPNYRSRDGNSPLSNAVLCDDTEIAEILLTHGALIDATIKGGGTVMDCAKETQKPSMVRLLAKYGGK